jgi:hypothetical protein
MKVTDKRRLRELRYSPEGGAELDAKLAYLLSYGDDKMQVEIRPSADEPYISVAWTLNGEIWMIGALLRHKDGTWSVHT